MWNKRWKADKSNAAACIEMIARRSLTEIATRFPALHKIEESNAPVEISLTIPAQSGCKYEISLSLQGDELHFSVENFWLEWFPCTDPERVDAYIDAVDGFLSGRYRILEHYRGAKCVKAELQVPEAADWRVIGTSSTLWLPFPWKKTFREIRNV